jgi:AcrR family transcriptional regulator
MLANSETRVPAVAAAVLDPRKSPRQRRSQATVEAIVEAAARILETDGPAGFNTNAVARCAGVSVGSLYQYFPSKQALVAELSRRNAEAALAGLARAAEGTRGLPLAERLRAFVAFAIGQQGARPRLSRVLDQLEAGLALVTDAAATGPAILALLTPVLAQGSAGDTAELEVVAGDCLALARTLIDRSLDGGGRDSLKVVEDRIVGALAGYLAAAGVAV